MAVRCSRTRCAKPETKFDSSWDHRRRGTGEPAAFRWLRRPACTPQSFERRWPPKRHGCQHLSATTSSLQRDAELIPVCTALLRLSCSTPCHVPLFLCKPVTTRISGPCKAGDDALDLQTAPVHEMHFNSDGQDSLTNPEQPVLGTLFQESIATKAKLEIEGEAVLDSKEKLGQKRKCYCRRRSSC